MTARKEIFASIVIPVRNQGLILKKVLSDLSIALEDRFTNYEIIVVDDASSDDTENIVANALLRLKAVRFLRLTREFGVEICAFAGLEQSIGDCTVVYHPETDPLEIIVPAILKCSESEGIIYGENARHKDYHGLVLWLSNIFHYYCEHYLEIRLPHKATDFRVFNRQILNAITQIRDRYPLLRLYGSTVGVKSLAYPYVPLQELKIEKNSLFRRITEGIEIIVASTKHPLRLVTRIGLGVGLVSFVWSFTSLSMDRLLLGLCWLFLFLILTIFGEYLGRILEESQSRPLYYVLYEKNSNVSLVDQRKNIVEG
jgi:glycosyltransferase involved in cell wall biosynthesis